LTKKSLNSTKKQHYITVFPTTLWYVHLVNSSIQTTVRQQIWPRHAGHLRRFRP